jgi:hypothetical protein
MRIRNTGPDVANRSGSERIQVRIRNTEKNLYFISFNIQTYTIIYCRKRYPLFFSTISLGQAGYQKVNLQRFAAMKVTGGDKFVQGKHTGKKL